MKKTIVICIVSLFVMHNVGFASSNQFLAGFEKNIGRSAKDELVAAYGGEIQLSLHEHLKVNEIFNRLVCAASNTPEEYSLTILNTQEVNAFALPGGYVFLTKGLLNLVGSGDERIAAALAHEIAHIEKKHGLNAILRQLGLNVMMEIGVILLEVPLTEAVHIATQALINVVQSGYSREAELEADRLAQEYLVAAGIDPAGMIHILFDLLRIKDQQIGAAIFNSHPSTDDRIEQLLERTPDFWSSPQPIDWFTVQTGQKQDPFNRFEVIAKHCSEGNEGITLYDLQNQKEARWVANLDIRELDFSHNGRSIAGIVCQAKTWEIWLWNRFGNIIDKWDFGSEKVMNIAFSPDGSQIGFNRINNSKLEIWVGFVNEKTKLNIAQALSGTIVGWDQQGIVVIDEQQHYMIKPPQIKPIELSEPVPIVIERKPRVTPNLTKTEEGQSFRLSQPSMFEL